MKLLRNLTIGVVSIFLAASTASAQVSIGAGASSLGGDGAHLTGGAIDVTGKFNEYLGGRCRHKLVEVMVMWF